MALTVLIVDDDPAKVASLSEFLQEYGVVSTSIRVAEDAASARRALKERYFDLMLLDVLLPSRKLALPAGDVSADFLREILEDETSPSPGRIVAMTADLEAKKKFDDQFARLVTQVLHVEVGREEWKYSLKCLIANAVAADAARNQFDLDVCFQVALRSPELSELLAVPRVSWSPEEPLAKGLLYRRGEMDLGKRKLRVACAHATQMGMVPAAHLTNAMIGKLKPRALLMTGICGSVGKDTKIGDVIVADKSWDWQAGKWDEHGTLQISPDQKDASSDLVSLSRFAEDSLATWYAEYAGAKPAHSPSLHVAPIASGSAVVADKDFHSLFKQQHRKVDGIDMECYGVYHAALLADEPAPKVLCVKAVSDRADSAKSNDYQHYCSYLSARTALLVAARYFGADA